MKRKILLAKLFACGMATLAVLTVLAGLAGCTKELQSPGDEGASGQGTVTRLGISAEGYVGDAGTKTSVLDKTVWWRTGDLVQLNVTDKTYAVTVNGENASIDVTDLNHFSVLYASYPAGVFGQNNNGMTFPSSYACTIDGGRQVIALPMMAYVAENTLEHPATSLEFKHQTAAVKVMLWNATPSPLTVTRVVVKTDSYKLNGSLIIIPHNTDPTYAHPPVNSGTESERQVEVTFPAYGEAGALVLPVDDQSHSVQVPFRPIGADQMTIEVEATDGTNLYYYSYKASSPALTRNQMMTARVKIDRTGANTHARLTIDSSTGELTLYDGDIISGTGGAKTHITIADGATVTLNGLTNKAISSSYSWAGITCAGGAVIVLEGTNEVQGSGYSYAGIYIPSGKTLTIHGSGSLKAVCGGGIMGGEAAGIGANYQSSCGRIVIEGGSIEALGGQHSAAIGGYGGWGTYSCGDVTITSGVTKIVASRNTNSSNSGTFIGKGAGGSVGTVTIDGRVMTEAEQNEPWNASLEFEHFTSTFNSNNSTWTLTHK